jgi:hypothetical protein
MSELLDQIDAVPEVIEPEQETAHVPEAEDSPAPTTLQPQSPPQEDIQEKNWRAARARMEDQQRHIQTLQQELELVRSRQIPSSPEEEEIEFETPAEKRLFEKVKALEAKVSERQRKDADYVLDRLKLKYPDFDDVVNSESITYLQTNNAALARALASLKDDPYEQGQAAYDALKNTEWFQQRHTMQDKAKVQQNTKKPVSVQAVRKQGALSEANLFANGLTPDLKKWLQQEMAESRKRA